MSLDTRALLAELSGIGVGVDEDDPIAQVALAQAAAESASEGDGSASASEELESRTPSTTATRPWRGARLLRDAASAAADDEPESDIETEVAEAATHVSRRAETRPAVNEEDADAGEDEAEDDEATSVRDLLVEIRDLMRQQVQLLSKIVGNKVGESVAQVPRVRRRSEASAAPTAEAVVSDLEPVTVQPEAPEAAATQQEDLRTRLAARQARLQERAAQERSRLAALMAQGLSSEDAMQRIEAEREAAEEAREAEAELAEDAVVDDVPMAESGVPGFDDNAPSRSSSRAAASKDSRGGSFDVDFDVSALSVTGR